MRIKEMEKEYKRFLQLEYNYYCPVPEFLSSGRGEFFNEIENFNRKLITGED